MPGPGGLQAGHLRVRPLVICGAASHGPPWSVPVALCSALCLDSRSSICRSMEAFKVDSWAETQFSSPAAAFASILDIVREYEVTLPGHICAVLVTVLVLEGWSSALKPEHSVLTEVKNLVAVDTSSWMERLSVCVEQWMEWAPVLPSLDTL